MVNASGKPRGNRRGPRRGKRLTPSPGRLRYDAKAPVVSFRVTADMRAALDDLRARGNLSIADVLRVGLGLLSPVVGASYNNGITYTLSELYLRVCYECEDVILAFADEHRTVQ